MSIRHDEIKFPGVVYVSADKSFRKTDFKTKEPIVTDDGSFYWQVPCLTAGEPRMEEFEVTIIGPVDPLQSAGLKPMTPVVFKGLTLSVGKMNSHKFFTYRADSVKAA